MMIDLREQYGRKYKTVKCQEGEGGCYEIVGKRGYIRPFGEGLEMYCTSSVMSGRAEKKSGFKAKNHYDDAAAFTFGPENMALACKWIKARNRKQFTPEQRVVMAARMRSCIKNPSKKGIYDT